MTPDPRLDPPPATEPDGSELDHCGRCCTVYHRDHGCHRCQDYANDAHLDAMSEAGMFDDESEVRE